jgi:hypothetical protein
MVMSMLPQFNFWRSSKQVRKYATSQMTELMRSLELQCETGKRLGRTQSTLSVERAVRKIEGRTNRLDVN